MLFEKNEKGVACVQLLTIYRDNELPVHEVYTTRQNALDRLNDIKYHAIEIKQVEIRK
jgi:hypothetical protein